MLFHDTYITYKKLSVMETFDHREFFIYHIEEPAQMIRYQERYTITGVPASMFSYMYFAILYGVFIHPWEPAHLYKLPP